MAQLNNQLYAVMFKCIFLIQIEDMHPSAMTNCHSLDEVDVRCSSATFNVGSSGYVVQSVCVCVCVRV